MAAAHLTPDPFVGIVIGLTGDCGVPHRIEAMRDTGKHMKLGRHAGLKQAQGIGDVLIPEPCLLYTSRCV